MVDTVVDQPTLTIRSSQIGEAYIYMWWWNSLKCLVT